MTATLPGLSPTAVLSASDFRRFSELAYTACGINLQQGKEQLVSARLAKVMRVRGIHSFDEYYRFVTADTTGKALEAMIDSLTTNHTTFFREPGHFEFLRQRVLPELERRRRFAIWSAACSTGEEPYSILFSLLDHLGDPALQRVRLLATDISTRVLARAERGLFENQRVASLSQDYLRKYFLKGTGNWADWLMVKKAIRDRIDFRRFNLVKGFHQPARFPVIFCRNVMIYFDSQTQAKVIHSLSECLEPGGYLFIGHSESLGSIAHDLVFIAPAVYRRKGSLKDAAR